MSIWGELARYAYFIILEDVESRYIVNVFHFDILRWCSTRCGAAWFGQMLTFGCEVCVSDVCEGKHVTGHDRENVFSAVNFRLLLEHMISVYLSGSVKLLVLFAISIPLKRFYLMKYILCPFSVQRSVRIRLC